MLKTLCAIALGAVILSSAPLSATPFSGTINAGFPTETTLLVRLKSLDTAAKPLNAACCKVCSKGKPCGDSCISKTRTCHTAPGCAC